MPVNEIITETIAKLTQRIEELKSQIGEIDIKSTTAYNTSVSLADAIAQQKAKLEAMTSQVNELEAQMAILQTRVNNIENTRCVTTTTPPTADGTGLPGFVVLDTKPETEYKNYVYIYPRE